MFALPSQVSDVSKDVNYTWTEFYVQKKHGFHGFYFSQIDQSYQCDKSIEQNSGHSCLKVKFALSRQLGHFLIRVYAPSFLIVITTFIGFWVSVQGYPARVRLLPWRSWHDQIAPLKTRQLLLSNSLFYCLCLLLDSLLCPSTPRLDYPGKSLVLTTCHEWPRTNHCVFFLLVGNTSGK